MTMFGLPEFQISAGVVVFIVVIMVLTGRLVPKRQLDDLREDRDARVAAAEHRAELFQAAYEAAVQSRRAADTHVTQLMETAIVTKDVLKSVIPAAELPEARSHATDQA
jgi:hypothetical protein